MRVKLRANSTGTTHFRAFEGFYPKGGSPLAEAVGGVMPINEAKTRVCLISSQLIAAALANEAFLRRRGHELA